MEIIEIIKMENIEADVKKPLKLLFWNDIININKYGIILINTINSKNRKGKLRWKKIQRRRND